MIDRLWRGTAFPAFWGIGLKTRAGGGLPLAALLLLLAVALPAPGRGAPVTGDLEFVLPSPAPGGGEAEFFGGIIELRGEDLTTYQASLLPPDAAGRMRAGFRGLPAGSYSWRILQSGLETAWNLSKIDIAPGTRTLCTLRNGESAGFLLLNPTAALTGLDDAARLLPGAGIEPLEQLSTFPEQNRTPSWETLELNNPSRREPFSVNIPMALSQTSAGFASLTAPWDPDGWRAARRGRRDRRAGLFGAGRADSYQRLDGTGRVALYPRRPLNTVLDAVGRFRSDEDPYPRKTADNPREDSELLEQEIYAHLRLQPGGRAPGSWQLTSNFAGAGKEQDYLLKSYQANRDHSPREESASLLWDAGLEKEFPYTKHLRRDGIRGPWRHRLRLHAQYTRNFREIGDGVYFDDLNLYGRPDGNAATVNDSTEWRGDDPSTAFFDEGHVYNNYRLHVANSWETGLTWESMLAARSRLRAEIIYSAHAVRYYEHFDPRQTFRGIAGGGYQSVRRFGYTIDAAEREDSGRLEVPEITAGLFWESVGARGLWQASLYGLWYRSEHAGPADWTHLPDADSSLEDFNRLLEKPGWTGGAGGSLGRSILAGRSTVLWLRGQEKVNRPPLLALGVDPVFLQRAVYLGLPEAPFGNPHLGPENEMQLEAGARFQVKKGDIPLLGSLLSRLSGGPRLFLQATLYGSWTRNAWVEKETSSESGALVYIDDSGRRRARGIHLDLRSAQTPPATGMWLYASYDLARTEFKGGGPLSLDAGIYEPDLPLGTPRVRETTDTFATPVSAWEGRGYRPTTLDRTHRFRMALIYKTPKRSANAWLAPLTDLAFGLATRWESGRPYTPIAVNSEALVGPAEILGVGDPHSERMPNTFRIDFSTTKSFKFQRRELTLRFEVLNITGRRNALRVYRATGEPDDDGFLLTHAGEEMIDRNGEGFVSTYQEALEDPFNFDIPTTFRISAEVSLSRLPAFISY
jgi:hypothetical protein